jgi:hypothetical protein
MNKILRLFKNSNLTSFPKIGCHEPVDLDLKGCRLVGSVLPFALLKVTIRILIQLHVNQKCRYLAGFGLGMDVAEEAARAGSFP